MEAGVLVPRGSWPGYGRGPADRLLVQGRHAYLEVGAGGVLVFDTADPRHLSPAGSYHNPNIDLPRDIAVANGRLLAVSWSSGLDLADLTAPAHPVPIASHSRPDSPLRLRAAGNLAYIFVVGPSSSNPLDPFLGPNLFLKVVDVSDPRHPQELGAHRVPTGTIDFVVSEGFVFVVTTASGLHVLDARNAASIAEIGTLSTSGAAANLALAGSRLLIASSTGLEVVDVQDPAHPRSLGHHSVENGSTRIAVEGTTAYLAKSGGGLLLLDVSDPAQPRPLGTFPTKTGLADLAVLDGIAWVSAPESGITTIDCTVPVTPVRLGTFETRGSVSHVTASGTRLFVSDGPAGFRILDGSDPDAPRQLSVLEGLTPGPCLIEGDYAYLAAGLDGLRVVNVRDPANPRVIGAFDSDDINDSANALAKLDHYLYLATFNDVGPAMPRNSPRLRVIDVSDPTHPVQLRSFTKGTPSAGFPISPVLVRDGYLHVGDVPYQIYSLTDPTRPALVSTPAIGDAVGVLAFRGSYAYSLAQGGFLYLADLTDIRNPVGLGYRPPLAFDASSLLIDGRYGFSSGQRFGIGGIHLLDFQDPLHPVWNGAALARAWVSGLAKYGSRVYAAELAHGFQIYEFTDTPSPPVGLRIVLPDYLAGSPQPALKSPAALEAVVRYEDGGQREVTADVRWEVLESTVPGVHFVGAELRPGLVTWPGICRVRATYLEGHYRAVADQSLVVVPTDTAAALFEAWAEGTGDQAGLEYHFAVATPRPNGLRYRWTIPDSPSVEGIAAEKVFPGSGDFEVRLDAILSAAQIEYTSTLVRRIGVERRAPGEPPSYAPPSPRPGTLETMEGAPLVLAPAEAQIGLLVLIRDQLEAARPSWIAELARAVRLERTTAIGFPPAAADYNWSTDAASWDAPVAGGFEPSAGETPALSFHLASRNQRTLAEAHGQALAGQLRELIRTGQLSRTSPIHLVGHGVGGLIAAECATLLQTAESDPIVVAQVTLLDTAALERRHVTRFARPASGRVDRYITTAAAAYAPKLDGLDAGWVNAHRIDLGLDGLRDFPWDGPLDLYPRPAVSSHSRYARVNVPQVPADDPATQVAHRYATQWYLQTVANSAATIGYALSPWKGRSFPSTASAVVPEDLHPEKPAYWATFGRVTETNGVFTLGEAGNAGLRWHDTLPLGAQELQFAFRFSKPGDGDFLAITWGTNVLLGLGLDESLSRSGFVQKTISIAPFAGQTGDLVVRLVSRGAANAELQLRDPVFRVREDPDLDGLSSDLELTSGTDPLNADTDGDGLLDGEELRVYLTDPRLVDTDGDGLADGDEARAGFFPNDASSVLRPRIEAIGADTLTLAWEAPAGRLCRVLTTTGWPADLVETVVEHLPAAQPTTRSVLSRPAKTARFYWVEIE